MLFLVIGSDLFLLPPPQPTPSRLLPITKSGWKKFLSLLSPPVLPSPSPSVKAGKEGLLFIIPGECREEGKGGRTKLILSPPPRPENRR